MKNLKAIPTKYNGVQYRSRLEARWAMFFDYLDIEYYYEHEGYQLPSAWYLPDFFLPKHGWFEIKPEKPSKEEQKTANEMQAQLMGNKRCLDINYNDIQDYSKSHYILVNFPLKQVFRPYRSIDTEIFSDTFGEMLEGNYWLEDDTSGEIYFSINLTDLITQEHIEDSIRNDELLLYLATKQYSCVNCLKIAHGKDYSKLVDGTCKLFSNKVSGAMTAMADYISSMRLWMINYDHQDSINDLNESLQKTERIYNQLKEENERFQRQCPHRNSKRINDAYQMAFKHRFY